MNMHAHMKSYYLHTAFLTDLIHSCLGAVEVHDLHKGAGQVVAVHSVGGVALDGLLLDPKSDTCVRATYG